MNVRIHFNAFLSIFILSSLVVSTLYAQRPDEASINRAIESLGVVQLQNKDCIVQELNVKSHRIGAATKIRSENRYKSIIPVFYMVEGNCAESSGDNHWMFSGTVDMGFEYSNTGAWSYLPLKKRVTGRPMRITQQGSKTVGQESAEKAHKGSLGGHSSHTRQGTTAGQSNLVGQSSTSQQANKTSQNSAVRGSTQSSAAKSSTQSSSAKSSTNKGAVGKSSTSKGAAAKSSAPESSTAKKSAAKKSKTPQKSDSTKDKKKTRDP